MKLYSLYSNFFVKIIEVAAVWCSLNALWLGGVGLGLGLAWVDCMGVVIKIVKEDNVYQTLTYL